MKRILILGLLAFFAAFITEAQIIDPKKALKNEGENRTNQNINNGVDAGFDKVEEGIGSLFKKKKKKKKKKEETEEQSTDQTTEQDLDASSNSGEEPAGHEDPAAKQPNVQWAKFDFVPGDEVIFEDGPDIMEENGEFPSRWDLVSGQVEIANVDGENVIMFLDGSPMIIPYLENSNEDYLPDVFTVEFDMYTPKDGNRFQLYLTDRKNQRTSESQEFQIRPIRVDAPGNITVEHSSRDYTYCENGCWTHVSLAYTKGKMKVYIDDTRLINIPHYEFNPSGITIQAYFASAKDNQPFYLKNVRIAKGGVKYYKRVLSDGKIVCNGIRFDVNKATLKPESMGPINKVFQLMQKQPDLKFSVEGHTDSDGDDQFNLKLSEERAKAVMDQLISMGIAADRLKYKGFGESQPIGNNTTAEGKANNRRVEFVKFD